MTAPAPNPHPRFSNATRRSLVGIILALFALQVVLTSRQMSPYYDESTVLSLGSTFLKTGQWHLAPEHPPLIFALCALPLMALDLRPDLTYPSWLRRGMNIWTEGWKLVKVHDLDRLLFWGRLPILLLALLLGYVVYRWARELYGDRAGVMALLLYAFCPTIIAFSGYTSYDLGLACFFTLSAYAFWRFTAQGTWHNLLWTGLLLGLALGSKTPAIVLPPVFLGLMLLAARRPPRQEASDPAGPAPAASLAFPLAAEAVRDRLRLSLAALALIFLMAGSVLYTIYAFPDDPLFYVRGLLIAPHLVTPGYPFYLMGRFRPEGWWYYFLVAFLIKTPIPMLLLLPLAVWHWRRRGGRWFPEACLVLPALALVLLISAMAPAMGLRYLLPIYPLLFIFVSRTAPLFTRKPAGVIAGLILAVWYLSTPIRIYPDYLAYFNEFVGGPRNGIEYLDDANLDWGQNLKRLKRYLDARRFDRVRLFYYSIVDPAYYGIHAEPLRLEDLARTPEPGIYVINSHGIVRARGYFKIDWLKRYELLDHVGYAFYVFNVR
jgi:hypothetical protein